MMEIAFDQNNDGMISDEEATFYLSGHESYDQETFVSTGWLLMKQLFSRFENVNKNDNADKGDQDVKDDLSVGAGTNFINIQSIVNVLGYKLKTDFLLFIQSLSFQQG